MTLNLIVFWIIYSVMLYIDEYFKCIPGRYTNYIIYEKQKQIELIFNDDLLLALTPCPTILMPTLNVRGPSYLGLISLMSWLLMPWLLTSPGHQQPWYWLYRICMSFCYLRKCFKYLCQINVEEWHKMQIHFFVPSENLARKLLWPSDAMWWCWSGSILSSLDPLGSEFSVSVDELILPHVFRYFILLPHTD